MPYRHFTDSVLLATLALTLGCGEEPPALEVAGVGYSAQEVLGLSPSRLRTLEDLTLLAVATARGELAELGAPLVALERDQGLWRRLQAEEVLAAGGVTDENLRAMYATDPEYELTVRHLIVLSERFETDETRGRAREKAERALARIQAGEPFPEVAAEVSEEPGAEGRQGLLEPGRRGAWVDEFWSAANALEVGGISGVVETQYGFHVLRLEAREAVPFNEVRGTVVTEAATMMARIGGDVTDADLPPGFRLTEPAEGAPEPADEATAAAAWEGGSLSVGQVLDHAASQSPATWSAAVSGQAEAWSRAAEDAARRGWVRARVAELDEADEAAEAALVSEARESWLTRTQGWTTLFGFREGLSEDALKATSLSALSATGQSFQLARDELAETRGLLERYAQRLSSRAPE